MLESREDLVPIRLAGRGLPPRIYHAHFFVRGQWVREGLQKYPAAVEDEQLCSQTRDEDSITTGSAQGHPLSRLEPSAGYLAKILTSSSRQAELDAYKVLRPPAPCQGLSRDKSENKSLALPGCREIARLSIDDVARHQVDCLIAHIIVGFLR